MRTDVGELQIGALLSEGRRRYYRSGNGKEELEKVSDWHFVALALKVRAVGELSMLDLSLSSSRTA